MNAINPLRQAARLVTHRCRCFATSAPSRMSADKLRIGYVPEHFSAPLHFAYSRFGLSDRATLRPFPSGTGTMIEAFAADEIDVGIGLTEAWIAGLAKAGTLTGDASKDSKRLYHLYSSYVQSPLRWALSTGANRADFTDMDNLDGSKVGVSRMGSGSHIMSFVLADQKGWLKEKGVLPLELVVCGPFAPLREAVTSGKADFFMWEYYTTKKFYDDGTLKYIGEIPTPWNSWHIVAKGHKTDPRVEQHLAPALEEGIKFFADHKSESIDFITANMEYSKEDATSWYSEVEFPSSIGHINDAGVSAAIASLQKAGVITSTDTISSNVVKSA